MPNDHVWQESLNVGGDVSTKTDTITGEESIEIDLPAASRTNVEVEIQFLVAGLKSFRMESSASMTVKTNDATTPAQAAIVLGANDPLSWHNQMPYANPFTANVTKFFITGTGTFKVRGLKDATP